MVWEWRNDAGAWIRPGFREHLTLLRSLSVTVDATGSPEHRERILALMRLHRLSAYDATYLELASRLDLPLLSLDKALLAAAAATGVRLLS